MSAVAQVFVCIFMEEKDNMVTVQTFVVRCVGCLMPSILKLSFQDYFLSSLTIVAGLFILAAVTVRFSFHVQIVI